MDTVKCRHKFDSSLGFFLNLPNSKSDRIFKVSRFTFDHPRKDWLLNSELKSCPARMAQTLMQNMNWACDENTLLLPLSIHQKFANIVIRRHLELASNSANLVSKTQDTLGLNSAKAAQLSFLNVQLARFLLHPMLRKSRSNQEIQENGDSMLIEAHSNPLLGPAVLNSKVPCCAYLLATMLDSTEGRVSAIALCQKSHSTDTLL